MGIDIERGCERGRSVGRSDADAGEWRGCGRRSHGDLEIHLEQGNCCHSFGGSSGRCRSSSTGSGATNVNLLSITKCHFERDIGNRGNEVGGIFILAKPDRAASDDTVTEQLWSGRDPRTTPLVSLPGQLRPLPIPSPTSADGAPTIGTEYWGFRLTPAKVAVRAGWEFVAATVRQQQQQHQREFNSNWYSESAKDNQKWNRTDYGSKWSQIMEQRYKWNGARSRKFSFCWHGFALFPRGVPQIICWRWQVRGERQRERSRESGQPVRTRPKSKATKCRQVARRWRPWSLAAAACGGRGGSDSLRGGEILFALGRPHPIQSRSPAIAG